jgi:RNA-binding protein
MSGIGGKQRQHLRGLAHRLSPLVQVGKEGVSDRVLGAVDRALADHELIKVKVLETSPLDPRETGEALADALRAELVQGIGRVVVLYRRHPERPRITLPRPARQTVR